MFAESVSVNVVGRLEKSCHPWEGTRNIVQIHVVSLAENKIILPSLVIFYLFTKLYFFFSL